MSGKSNTIKYNPEVFKHITTWIEGNAEANTKAASDSTLFENMLTAVSAISELDESVFPKGKYDRELKFCRFVFTMF